LCGALKHTDLVQPGDREIPVFLVHGTADNIVHFGIGSAFQAATLPPTYGSSPISERFTALDIPNQIYFVEDEGHEFYGVSNGNWNHAPNNYWYIIVEKSIDFLYQRHKPIAAFRYSANSRDVQFTDQSSGDALVWQWDFGDGEYSAEHHPGHTYALDGSYLV